MELEKGYEKEEREIVNNATENGVPFETAATIKENIKKEGVDGYEFIQMLKGKLRDEIDNEK